MFIATFQETDEIWSPFVLRRERGISQTPQKKKKERSSKMEVFRGPLLVIEFHREIYYSHDHKFRLGGWLLPLPCFFMCVMAFVEVCVVSPVFVPFVLKHGHARQRQQRTNFNRGNKQQSASSHAASSFNGGQVHL